MEQVWAAASVGANLRLRIVVPTQKKPINIIAQIVGSGTPGQVVPNAMSSSAKSLPERMVFSFTSAIQGIEGRSDVNPPYLVSQSICS